MSQRTPHRSRADRAHPRDRRARAGGAARSASRRWWPSARLRARRQRLAGAWSCPAGSPLAAAVAAGVAAVALVVGLSGGGSGGSGSTSSLRAASQLTLGPATMSAPAESTRSRRTLTAAVDGVLPLLGGELRLARHRRSASTASAAGGHDGLLRQRAAGSGSATRSSRAPRPAHLSGGAVAWRDGTAYHLLRINGAQAVAWLRAGRLCVVSGRGVDGATLLRLASWHDHGRSPREPRARRRPGRPDAGREGSRRRGVSQ